MERVGPVFRVEKASVRAPEDFIRGMRPLSGEKSLIYFTFLKRIRRSVLPCMMNQPVHVLPEEVIGAGVAEKAKTGLIGESTTALKIDAADCFRRGIEQEPDSFLTAPGRLHRQFSLGDIFGDSGAAV